METKEDSLLDVSISEKTLVTKDLDRCYADTIIEDAVLSKTKEIIDRGQSEAFFVYNPNSVAHRVKLWQQYLPEVELFYAVKSNSD